MKVSIFFLLLWSCCTNALGEDLHKRKLNFENGDIVVRMGSGMWSNYFASLSKNERKFSHAGIIVITNGVVYVAEETANDFTGVGGAHLVTFEDFNAGSSQFGLYRLKLPDVKRSEISKTALQLVAQAVPFDSKFSLDSQDFLYCTEFVWYSIRRAVNLDIVPVKSSISGKEYISVEDLYKSTYVQSVPY